MCRTLSVDVIMEVFVSIKLLRTCYELHKILGEGRSAYNARYVCVRVSFRLVLGLELGLNEG